ncbi:DNA repair and recombination protein [Aureococcus anophagefferens]|uniref:DNA repair and recombination protein n=1 Tax=Aureococcus anophagefferens TaxID=44056 RepID=A0ABR1FYD4_AURAN
MPGFYGGGARARRRTSLGAAARAEGPRLGDRLLETLRPHQVEGVSWVCARLWQNQGCVLADEMGLGKTATVLASLGVLMGVDGAAALETERSFRAAGGSPHCCFFADADAAELRAFKRRSAPAGPSAAKKVRRRARDDWDADPDDAVARFARAPLSSKPVLVISYESYRARPPRQRIKDQGVGLLVCDEAHRLKGGDDRVEAAAAIGDSPARKKLFVTATPVQNGVPELENLLRLAGALGRRRATRAADARALRSALSARTLRRGVEDAPALLGSLPRRRDALVFVDATPTQRALFAARATKAQGLRALTAAKHLCSSVKALDPALDDGGDTVGKWAFAERLLDSIRANDAREKVVLVSQFAATLDAGAALAARRGWGCARVDGATALDARRDAAAALNDPDGGVFLLLLALKAGGVGLTLTGASRLILFEPSWNPADDDQAAARVWRDGQTRPTFIYTLATAHSLEEHVLKRQAAKRNLAGRVRHAQREVALLDLAEMEARFDADRDARDDLATLLALGTSSPDAPCALFAPGGPPEYRGDAPLAAAAAAAVQVDHLPDRFAPA